MQGDYSAKLKSSSTPEDVLLCYTGSVMAAVFHAAHRRIVFRAHSKEEVPLLAKRGLTPIHLPGKSSLCKEEL